MTNENEAVKTYRFGERLHFGNADRIRNEIDYYFTQSQMNKLVLDLEAVRECDSSGLKLLLDAKRKGEARKIAVVLLSPRPVIMDLLKLTRLDTIFTIVQDRSKM